MANCLSDNVVIIIYEGRSKTAMRGAQRRRGFNFALGALLTASCAFALNPALDISQYAHPPFPISDGFAKGYIYSIAQTPDGYLWLGTEFGVLRFDGVRTLPPPDRHFPTARMNGLVVSRDGTLWIASRPLGKGWPVGRLASLRTTQSLLDRWF